MLPSSKFFAVFMGGVTLTAARGYAISESYTRSELEMSVLLAVGITMLLACVPYELVRRVQKLNKKYANG